MAVKYERYHHAGEIPFAEWRNSGIRVPIFDKDGTLTHANRHDFVDEVVDGLVAQNIPDVFPDIALVSNNHDHTHVEEFAGILRRKLGMSVFALSRAQGHKSKPDPEMGLVVASHFDVEPEQLGVIGDRLLTDVAFGRRLGAGAIALCDKAGDGDAKWVPQLRVVEAGLVTVDRILGRTA